MISGLDTETLLKMLSAVGVNLQAPAEEIDSYDQEPPERWNDLVIETKPDNRPLKLLDKSKFMVQKGQTIPGEEAYMDDENSNLQQLYGAGNAGVL
jgi:hypothetical protein